MAMLSDRMKDLLSQENYHEELRYNLDKAEKQLSSSLITINEQSTKIFSLQRDITRKEVLVAETAEKCNRRLSDLERKNKEVENDKINLSRQLEEACRKLDDGLSKSSIEASYKEELESLKRLYTDAQRRVRDSEINRRRTKSDKDSLSEELVQSKKEIHRMEALLEKQKKYSLSWTETTNFKNHRRDHH